jgi:tetratricopeptide (TPR) repeat protein
VAARLTKLFEFYNPNSAASYNFGRQVQQLAVDLDDRDVAAKVNLVQILSSGMLNEWSADEAADADEAEHLLADARAVLPGWGRVLAAKCQLLRAEKHYQAAVKQCRQATQDFPRSAFLQKELGFSEVMVGQDDEAERAFLAADQLEPNSPLRWSWYLGIGRIEIVHGHDQEAIDWLRRAVEDAPFIPRSLAYLAAAYALANMKDEARDASARFSKLMPAMTIAMLEGRSAESAPSPGTERLLAGLRLAGLPD